jgi:formylglycine-generating enzyme required for sulfatase activity
MFIKITQSLVAALVFAVCVTFATPSRAVTVAVLPLEPLHQATPTRARWIEGKLHRELRRQRATIITGAVVKKAMAALGVTKTSACDMACMIRIGKAVGADRVLAPTLRLQRKEQSNGTVWKWKTVQVHVKKGKAWGTFMRRCMCHEKAWDGIARRQVRRMLAFDPAKVVRLEPSAPRAKITKGPRDEPGMVFVPAGPFIMGSQSGESDEEPIHRVDLSAYFIDKYEVSNAQYTRCVEAKKCMRQRYHRDRKFNQPKQAVVGVGWVDGVNYCRFAGKRLPTEAEWEKAARGTDERIYPWGNAFNAKWLNMHNADDGFPTVAPVGSFPQNVSPYGAYDMAGNAWEWTHDFWNSMYYRGSPQKDPQGPKSGVRHVMRGGSWMYDVPFFATTHNRSPGRPWIRKRYVGFRCAKPL